MNDKNNHDKNIDPKVKEVIKEFKGEKEVIPSDILGSYTGMTKDDEKPVQDADDL